MTLQPIPGCATLCGVRFVRACLDLLMMAAPILLALAVVGGTLVLWPGPIPGILILLIVGWLCMKQIAKIRDEHHS